jgi:integrase
MHNHASSDAQNKREHTFPLLPLASKLIASSPNMDTGLLFPARGKPNAPFNGWSKSKGALDKLSGVTGWTLHDCRRTFATRLAELAVAPHVIERLLNHATGTVSGVAAVYNRASYMAEMRAAIELWERYLEEKVICGEQPGLFISASET